jgi:hypothetical protein
LKSLVALRFLGIDENLGRREGRRWRGEEGFLF